MKTVEKPAVGAWIFVDGDGQNGQIGMFVVQLDEGRRFLDAGRALTPPEVQKNHFATVVRKVDGVLAVIDSKIGGHLAGLTGVGATVASGNQEERRQSNQSE